MSVPVYIALRYSRSIIALPALALLTLTLLAVGYGLFVAVGGSDLPVLRWLVLIVTAGALALLIRMLWRPLIRQLNVINYISLITVMGLTLGTAAFVLVLSVFNGFAGLVISIYGSFYPDLRLQPAIGKTFTIDSAQVQALRSIDGIEAMSLVLEENALLAFDDKQHVATVKGVQDGYGRVTGIDTSMRRYGREFRVRKDGMDYAVLGYGVADALGIGGFEVDPLNPLSVYMPKRGKGISIMPGQDFRRKEIAVWGRFAIQDEFDQQYVFMPIDFVRELLQYPSDQVSGIEINTRPGMEKKTRRQIEELFGPGFMVQSQFEQNALLFKVMRVENLVVYLIFIFILMIVAFNMIGSLSMTVIDKKLDIGILKAMGATPALVRRLFLTEGLIQAGVSILFGFLIALVLGMLQMRFEFIKLSGGGTFLIEGYPVKFKVEDFAFVTLIVLGIALIASLVPAVRASRESQLITN